MAHPDDPSPDANTEWLSPGVYRQLCDAVDAALTTPPEARHALLTARLGNDERLLAEAHALLASYEASPQTVLTLVPPAPPESEGATIVIPPSAAAPEADPGTQQVTTPVWEAPARAERSSGTVSIESPVAPFARPISGSRPAGGSLMAPGAYPVAPSEPWAAMPPPADPQPIYQAPPPPAEPQPIYQAPPPPSAPAPAAIPTRPPAGASSVATALGVLLIVVMALAVVAAVWFWVAADRGRNEAEARAAQTAERLGLSEKRFDVVRQLGTRLAEVDRMLAVTDDAGARAARTVLVRTWLQYLQDLQRASGGTDRALLLEIAQGYRQVAATQGGVGRTLDDLPGAGKTLQIGIRLLEYLDRTGRQPESAILRELTVSTVALGDVLALGKDSAAATEQYRKALAVAERLGGVSAGDPNVTRDIETVRQRLQGGPPASP